MRKFRQIYERPTCLAAASLLRVWSSDRVLLTLPAVLVAPRAVRAGGQGGQYEEGQEEHDKKGQQGQDEEGQGGHDEHGHQGHDEKDQGQDENQTNLTLT